MLNPTFQMLHFFKESTEGIALPSQFTFPFHYSPHPLAEMAANEVMGYISSREDWNTELRAGKMFGVMIVETTTGDIGFIAAYSGNIANDNKHPYFVPPIYDLLDSNGFFPKEEKNISLLNHEIERITKSTEYIEAKNVFERYQLNAQIILEKAKNDFAKARLRREELRRNGNLLPHQAEALIKESQFQKAELKRIIQKSEIKALEFQERIKYFTNQIDTLKEERKMRSATLQKLLFEAYIVTNANGEKESIWNIFQNYLHIAPPGGTGECAAPKLLQYAYLNNLKPLAMAEFWWGDSPKKEIRHHGSFYPACKRKCEPLLGFMLQGLDVEDNPLKESPIRLSIRILYEDEWLAVIDKPSGLLSAPGKINADSVLKQAKELFHSATMPMIVHRLDMATSGLMIIAKDEATYKAIQSQFIHRQIKKTYIALLDGDVNVPEGIIDLPMCLDPHERPLQMVDYEYGKDAVTKYKVLSINNGYTLIEFHPVTGRTHQLRVHSAHPDGLNAPIVGDTLYGKSKSASRLMLHAHKITFRHPESGESITVLSPLPFDINSIFLKFTHE